MMNLIELKERIAIDDSYSLLERHLLLDLINTLPDAQGYRPPNYLPRIDSLFAFLSVDEGGEGVVAAQINGMMMPLIAADHSRVLSLRPVARHIGAQSGVPIHLVQFTERHDLELFDA